MDGMNKPPCRPSCCSDGTPRTPSKRLRSALTLLLLQYRRGSLFPSRVACPHVNVVVYPVPPHASDYQPYRGEEVKHQVVVEGERAVTVDGEGEQRREKDGRYYPRQSRHRHRYAVQLPSPFWLHCVVEGQRDCNVELARRNVRD